MFDFTRPVARPADFIGREELLDTLVGGTQSTVVIGEARIGRSSLLYRLNGELDGSVGEIGPRIPIFLNLRKPTLRSASDVYAALASFVHHRLEALLDGSPALPDTAEVSRAEDLIAFLDNLYYRGVKAEVVLILDNIEQPSGFMQSRLDFFSGLRKILDFSPGGSFRLVASASTEFVTLEPTIVSKLKSRLQEARLGAFSRAELALLAERDHTIRGSKEREVFCDYLFEQSGGHPCLAQELLANLQASRNPGAPIVPTLEREAAKLALRGGSFFDQYLRELRMSEVAHLIAVSYSTDALPHHAPSDILTRFSSAGLLAPTNGLDHAVPTCKLFFEWLRGNLGRVLPEHAPKANSIHSVKELRERLGSQLFVATEARLPTSERRLQDVLQGMLTAYGVPFRREEQIEVGGKKPRIDFGLPELDCALEVKLIKDQSKIGAVIDELLADLNHYSGHYSSFLAVVASIADSERLADFVSANQTPFQQFLVIPLPK